MSSSDIELCAGYQCFSPAACMVIPGGKWKNMPTRNACRACAPGMAKAYRSADNLGWAELYTLSGKPSMIGKKK